MYTGDLLTMSWCHKQRPYDHGWFTNLSSLLNYYNKLQQMSCSMSLNVLTSGVTNRRLLRKNQQDMYLRLSTESKKTLKRSVVKKLLPSNTQRFQKTMIWRKLLKILYPSIYFLIQMVENMTVFLTFFIANEISRYGTSPIDWTRHLNVKIKAGKSRFISVLW